MCKYPIQDGLKVLDGLHEAVAFDSHDHVDGVEVALATEAASEVGVEVDGGVEVMAQRAPEAEATVMGFVGQFEIIGDQRDDFDAIAQVAQICLRQRSGHGIFLSTAGEVRLRLRRRVPRGYV